MTSIISQAQERISSKTSDPQAADFDEAKLLFAQGIACARSGDLETGAVQISSAYLLDGRSIKFVSKLADDIGSASIEKNYVLDGKLLTDMLQNESPTSFSCDILHIMLAAFLGSTPGHGQELIAVAMVRIDTLVTCIQKNQEIEDPSKHILGGCLTRKALLYQKSSLQMGLGDFKNGMRSLTNALKIDEFYTQARESRACIWGSKHLRSDKTVHAEWKRVISENHVDNRGNEVAYAFLVLTTLSDSSLGTVGDARAWYDKMIAAIVRKDEIYGKRRQDELPPAVLSAQSKLNDYDGDLNIWDSIAGIERITVREKNRQACLKCGVTETVEGKRLKQCIKCKAVYYCSRECQVADWKEHKKLCKILKKGHDEQKK
eukprot:CAMPEP_0194447364 /NCGR_PEP_ID=MMETSP0176-20130528/128966_1 /TAXON_ID=216777 /ORGANISM="Proboscia alata, Strain PI-D3" /LENGTH=374 /DNA_ID=CAMNT_0039274213 /DNA_START=155 /DNA_END=1279 /DNA_ORIENTATION=-